MRHRADERGIALPSPVALVSLAAVVLAGAAFVTTSGAADKPSETARPVTAAAPPSPSETVETPVPKEANEGKERVEQQKEKKKEKETTPEPVNHGDVYVEVYNNSGISGLAGATASTIAGAGWQVVGSDNWYGTIPASTVYYPERLEKQAQMLATDLGISRIMPSISPMRFDRLTVILTSDYS